MYRYEGLDDLVANMTDAVAVVAAKHGLEVWDALTLCAVIESISSPLKLHKLKGSLLSRPMGEFGIKTYYASLIARAVEQIKSPHSLVVNPMMEAIIAALANESGPMPEAALAAQAQRLLALHCDGSEEKPQEVSPTPAFHSPLRYLSEAGLIERSEPHSSWQLSVTLQLDFEQLREPLTVRDCGAGN
ncbi:MAG TPA: hypothetical protein VGU01_14730 [Sphingomicrobium sp.]|nr:hypothetical protein [Sphingomicrobium sp.]